MYSTFYCWSRTSWEKSKWTKLCQNQKRIWNSRPEATRYTRSRQSLTVWYIASRQTVTKCQAFIISFYGRASQKKKIPNSLYWQLCTSGSWSAPFIKSIWGSRQRPLHPWILFYQWLGQQFWKSQNESVAVKVKEPISEAESRTPSSNVFCGPRRRCCAKASNPEPPTISRPYPQAINQISTRFSSSFS